MELNAAILGELALPDQLGHLCAPRTGFAPESSPRPAGE
jgi:hypothetical protein